VPHIVKKSYLFSYLAFCLIIPLLYISGDHIPLFGMHNTTSVSVAATVTTTLSSSVSGNTFYEGDAITFSTTPPDGTNYRFYINGILKQGPDN
jgi:preprotein translocase subunit SecY